MRIVGLVFLMLIAGARIFAQDVAKTASAAASVMGTWAMIEKDFIAVADAMPEDKYGFVPTAGEFKGARTFGEQVQHVACANFAFFKEFNGITPDEDCRYNGQEPKMSKAEIMKYLRDSFQFADAAIAKLTPQNSRDKAGGPYGGPSTK